MPAKPPFPPSYKHPVSKVNPFATDLEAIQGCERAAAMLRKLMGNVGTEAEWQDIADLASEVAGYANQARKQVKREDGRGR